MKFKDSPKQPASQDEQLKELDRKFGVIIERIQAYDAVLIEFKKLSDTFFDLQNKHQEIKTENNKLSDSINSVAKKTNSFEQSFDELSQKCFTLIENSREDCLIENRKLNENLLAKIENLSNEFRKTASSDKSEHQNLIDNLNEDLKNHKKDSLDKLLELSLKSDGLASHSSQCRSSINELSNNFEALKDGQEKIQESFSASSKEWKQEVSNVFSVLESYKKEINSSSDEKISSALEKIQTSPQKWDELQTKVLREIEISKLDSSNSILKVNNCLKQIEILERKIESLGILIKKLEMGK